MALGISRLPSGLVQRRGFRGFGAAMLGLFGMSAVVAAAGRRLGFES